MPCRDPREYDEPERVAKELNERTDMLCRTIRSLQTSKDFLLRVPQDVLEWYNVHADYDKDKGR